MFIPLTVTFCWRINSQALYSASETSLLCGSLYKSPIVLISGESIDAKSFSSSSLSPSCLSILISIVVVMGFLSSSSVYSSVSAVKSFPSPPEPESMLFKY